MAYLTTQTQTLPSFLARLGDGARGLAARLRRYKHYRETFIGLSALSDRDLDDLGLHRSELRDVAWASAHK